MTEEKYGQYVDYFKKLGGFLDLPTLDAEDSFPPLDQLVDDFFLSFIMPFIRQIGTAAFLKLADLLDDKIQLGPKPANLKKVGQFTNWARWVHDEPETFFVILAEFCEPLIERPAPKPEGGQDAAKA